VDEVDVRPVDLGHEVRQGVQLRLAPAPVVLRRPVAGEFLNAGPKRRRLGFRSCQPSGLPGWFGFVVDAEQAVLDEAGAFRARQAGRRSATPATANRLMATSPDRAWAAEFGPGPGTHPRHPDPAPRGAASGAMQPQRNIFTEGRQGYSTPVIRSECGHHSLSKPVRTESARQMVEIPFDGGSHSTVLTRRSPPARCGSRGRFRRAGCGPGRRGAGRGQRRCRRVARWCWGR
jgi:hypothetical protein